MFAAAIIAKNEEKNIEKCINSLLPFCKQIVVVDTGSSDNTPILAARLGAEVYFYLWNNSFSAAKNFAIQHIRKDWIISIDADEILDKATFSSFICEEFENIQEKTGGILVTLNNYLSEDLSVASQHNFTRIFRKSPKIFFQRKIHEQIQDSLTAARLSTYKSNIIFHHFGYIGKNLEKIARNKQLLEENIENDYDLYHLAATEFAAGDFIKALELFSNLVNSKILTEEQISITKIRMGQIFLHLDKFEEAKNILNFNVSDINWEGLRQNILLVAALMQNDFTAAKELYEKFEINNSILVDRKNLEKIREILLINT